MNSTGRVSQGKESFIIHSEAKEKSNSTRRSRNSSHATASREYRVGGLLKFLPARDNTATMLDSKQPTMFSEKVKQLQISLIDDTDKIQGPQQSVQKIDMLSKSTLLATDIETDSEHYLKNIIPYAEADANIENAVESTQHAIWQSLVHKEYSHNERELARSPLYTAITSWWKAIFNEIEKIESIKKDVNEQALFVKRLTIYVEKYENEFSLQLSRADSVPPYILKRAQLRAQQAFHVLTTLLKLNFQASNTASTDHPFETLQSKADSIFKELSSSNNGNDTKSENAELLLAYTQSRQYEIDKKALPQELICIPKNYTQVRVPIIGMTVVEWYPEEKQIQSGCQKTVQLISHIYDNIQTHILECVHANLLDQESKQSIEETCKKLHGCISAVKEEVVQHRRKLCTCLEKATSIYLQQLFEYTTSIEQYILRAEEQLEYLSEMGKSSLFDWLKAERSFLQFLNLVKLPQNEEKQHDKTISLLIHLFKICTTIDRIKHTDERKAGVVALFKKHILKNLHETISVQGGRFLELTPSEKDVFISVSACLPFIKDEEVASKYVVVGSISKKIVLSALLKMIIKNVYFEQTSPNIYIDIILEIVNHETRYKKSWESFIENYSDIHDILKKHQTYVTEQNLSILDKGLFQHMVHFFKQITLAHDTGDLYAYFTAVQNYLDFEQTAKSKRRDNQRDTIGIEAFLRVAKERIAEVQTDYQGLFPKFEHEQYNLYDAQQNHVEPAMLPFYINTFVHSTSLDSQGLAQKIVEKRLKEIEEIDTNAVTLLYSLYLFLKKAPSELKDENIEYVVHNQFEPYIQGKKIYLSKDEIELAMATYLIKNKNLQSVKKLETLLRTEWTDSRYEKWIAVYSNLIRSS